ncbi:glycoside hydrolase family 99-like domain-containing protein [Niabella yanshanensis]|uniref:Glycoside hydrolase family 99-like domain-containing protein n=1 Tax=Niabella yanshanensis TaxID=577386 RepID=A0ABZ0W4F5_9BACT|nr:glycoside hydrolase family 99-like domain-containing protein [Niabella yanshanensis]WQD36895.1 glycoside hydrolase family 99-like domain-containing protein [Niabella yanshanensis]
MIRPIRAIAHYLPQFHPIPENNKWWGTGFTEWTNVGKAKPLFRGHYQPRVPSDLGYYDLRLPEAREAQADMAREYGIEGFCYWHYWFGNGKQLLEGVFNSVLKSKKPDFPFCLAWANDSWSGVWHGVQGTLMEQTYPGVQDYEQHFHTLLEAFQDPRYILIDGKPLVFIFQPLAIPDPAMFIDIWQNMAVKNGLKGLHFVAHSAYPPEIQDVLNKGYDSVNILRLFALQQMKRSFLKKLPVKLGLKLKNVYDYAEAARYFSGEEDRKENVFPSLIPNWDHSPRTGNKRLILHNSTPELFRTHVRSVFDSVLHKSPGHRIVFIKSWNEWAEGNYIEPDLKYGKQYLEVFKEELLRKH